MRVAAPPAPEPVERTEQLIARYRRILDADPRETFAFQRLLELYRDRDGGLDVLVAALEAERAADAEAFAPLMLLGHLAKARGELGVAETHYRGAQRLRPRDPVPWVALGRVLVSSNDLTAAREALEAGLERTREDQDRRELRRELAELALDAGDFDTAAGHFAALARGPGAGPTARTAYARALLARDQTERAIAAYREALAALRGDNRVLAPVLRELADAQLAAGQPDEALETVDRALRLAGSRTGVRAELLDVLTRAHRQAETLPALAARLGLEARRFDEVELLGRVHDELGEDDEALAAYRRALRLDPRSVDTRVRVVQLLARSGRLEEVVGEYRALVRAAPREPRFVVELAQLLMQVGRRDEALRLAAETSRRHRRDVAVHQALAELYTTWGEEELATTELAALVRVEPRDPAHLVALGEQLLDAGDEAGALATWRRVLQVERDAGEAHATLARVFADHDRLELAERHWRDALREQPERVAWLRGLASVLERPRRGEAAPQRRERDLEAVQHWERVLVVAEDSAARREARRRVVGVWARRNELPAKLQEWRRAFAADPPDLGAGRFLAEAHLRSRPREVARAAAVLERVTALDPGDVESLLALERVRTAQGDLAGAIDVLERLAEADARKAPQYLQRMAEHAHALYRDEDAVRYAAAAVARSPDDAEAHRRLGDLLRARQQMERAIASYGRALELNDRLFDTYFDLAELQLARGETRGADALYREVLRRCPDDDLVARAGRASLQIHLGAGSLDVLEATLLPLAVGQARRPVFRKLAVEVYDVLVAPLAQTWRDGGEGSQEARAELDRLGRRALKPLLEALVDEDPAQQRVAVDVLGYLGNPNAAEPLIVMAEGDAPAELRLRAVIAAGTVADPSLASRFATLAAGPEHRLRSMAAWGLARMAGDVRGAPKRALVADVARLLGAGDASVRAFSALALGRAGARERSAALLARLREDRAPAVAASAAWALGQVGGASHLEVLVQALGRSQSLVRRAAAQALGTLRRRLGPEEAQRIDGALAEAFFDAEAELRRAAATAWAVSERPLAFPPPSVTHAGVYLSGRLDAGPLGTSLRLAPLRASIEAAARDALAGPVERVLAALTVLAPPSGTVPLGLGPLTEGLDGWPGPLRADAREVLDTLGRALADDLLRLVGHGEPAVREAALRRLRVFPPSVSSPAIAVALEDESLATRRAALEGIRYEHRGDPALVRAAMDRAESAPRWSERLAAVEALGRLGAPAALPLLQRALAHDPFAFVREGAARALAGQGDAEPALRAARDADPEPAVRAAAAAALQRR